MTYPDGRRLALPAILDLFSRRVVSFAMSKQNEPAHALEALERTLQTGTGLTVPPRLAAPTL